MEMSTEVDADLDLCTLTNKLATDCVSDTESQCLFQKH